MEGHSRPVGCAFGWAGPQGFGDDEFGSFAFPVEVRSACPPPSLDLLLTTRRFKLKFSPDKVDTMIVQAIALLDDLDKEINIYAMRVKVRGYLVVLVGLTLF